MRPFRLLSLAALALVSIDGGRCAESLEFAGPAAMAGIQGGPAVQESPGIEPRRGIGRGGIIPAPEF